MRDIISSILKIQIFSFIFFIFIILWIKAGLSFYLPLVFLWVIDIYYIITDVIELSIYKKYHWKYSKSLFLKKAAKKQKEIYFFYLTMDQLPYLRYHHMINEWYSNCKHCKVIVGIRLQDEINIPLIYPLIPMIVLEFMKASSYICSERREICKFYNMVNYQ